MGILKGVGLIVIEKLIKREAKSETSFTFNLPDS